MALDIVKQIIDVEKEGEELIKKAHIDAVEMQKQTEQEVNSIIKRAESEADKYYKDVISKYEIKANEEVKPIIKDSDKEKEELKNIPSDLLNKAVNMVIERIVNSHGNS